MHFGTLRLQSQTKQMVHKTLMQSLWNQDSNSRGVSSFSTSLLKILPKSLKIYRKMTRNSKKMKMLKLSDQLLGLMMMGRESWRIPTTRHSRVVPKVFFLQRSSKTRRLCKDTLALSLTTFLTHLKTLMIFPKESLDNSNVQALICRDQRQDLMRAGL